MPFSRGGTRRISYALLITGLLSLFVVVMFRIYPIDFASQMPSTSNPNITEARLTEFTVDEGGKAPYGIPLSQDSIPILVKYREDIELTLPQQQTLREALDIESPCCGGRVISCGCEHDRALQGLGKVLITRYGYSPQKVKAEAILWQRYFFPEYFSDRGT